MAGDIEAPKVDAPQLDAAAAAAVAAVADGNVQNVDFKNLSAEEAFQVLGVRPHARLSWHPSLFPLSFCRHRC